MTSPPRSARHPSNRGEFKAVVPLHDWQQRIVESPARFVMAMAHRQSGKSHAFALRAVRRALQADADGRQRDQIILAASLRQSKALARKVAAHLRAIGKELEVSEAEYDLDGGAAYSVSEIRLPGGTTFFILPASPETVRGFTGDILLDEFAFHRDAREIWQAIYPTISRGYSVDICSTPNGKRGKFYELWSGDNGYEKHRQTIADSVAAGLVTTETADELRTGIADADAWRQEYELEFLDEATAWLPWDLIDAAETDAPPPDAPDAHCFVGVDIARRNDLWVCFVLERHGDVCWTREVIAERNISFRAQMDILTGVYSRNRVVRGYFDQTGIGEMPTEEAGRRFGKTRAAGVIFTAAEKLDLATRLKKFFDDRRIRIPAGDAALRADLHSLQCEPTTSGAPRFVIGDEGDGHGDRTWALALALKAADTGACKYAYAGVPRWRHQTTSGDLPDEDFERQIKTRKWGDTSSISDFPLP